MLEYHFHLTEVYYEFKKYAEKNNGKSTVPRTYFQVNEYYNITLICSFISSFYLSIMTSNIMYILKNNQTKE